MLIYLTLIVPFILYMTYRFAHDNKFVKIHRSFTNYRLIFIFITIVAKYSNDLANPERKFLGIAAIIFFGATVYFVKKQIVGITYIYEELNSYEIKQILLAYIADNNRTSFVVNANGDNITTTQSKNVITISEISKSTQVVYKNIPHEDIKSINQFVFNLGVNKDSKFPIVNVLRFFFALAIVAAVAAWFLIKT